MSPAEAAEIRAAGAVVVREAAGDPEVLLVHRPRYRDWSLPKGKLRKGESHPLAAVRETREETGSAVRLGSPVGSVRYEVGGRAKEVRYWRATIAAAAVPAGPRVGTEVDEIAWLPAAMAIDALAHDTERNVVRAAVELEPTVPLVVVRHTAAWSRDDWPAADPDRPLEEAGNHDAVRLGQLLAAWSPRRVVSSPSRRCVESITPYAARVAATLELAPVLSEEEHERSPAALEPFLADVVADLRQELRTPAARSQPDGATGAVLCTHRPVLPRIADVLGVRLAVSAREEPLPLGGCWVLHLGVDRTLAIEQHRM